MTEKQLAAQIDGGEYGSELTKEQRALAKENGLVVVYGYSDDNVELEGAIDDEVLVPAAGVCQGVGACSGTRFFVGRHGVTKTFEQLKDDGADEEEFRAYFADASRKVEVVASFTNQWYIGSTLHDGKARKRIGEPFTIYEDGETFCRGVVFNLKVALA